MSDLIRPNFTRLELACRCGCGLLPPDDFLDALQDLRDELGAPMHIASGARCPDHNCRVSSTGTNGPHTIGAVDVRVSGGAALILVGVAMRNGWGGIGVKQHGPQGSRFIHLDRIPPGGKHPRPWIWSYA